MITGNKGEWSEFYTFVKLLADGKIYAADGELNKKEELFYTIVKILRGIDLEFIRTDKILIQNSENELLSELSIAEITEISKFVLSKINNAEAGTRAFSIPNIENKFSKLHTTTLSDERKDTADIRIVIHDPITQFKPLLGFSIKSYLGGKPTLFNASKNSNVIFKITPELTEAEIIETNNFDSYGKRFAWLQETSHKLEFVKMNNDIFSSNLELIDSSMPKIVSEIVLSKAFNGKNKIKDITADLKENNPCNYKINLNPNFYEYKIKRLLVDAALGMKAGKLWNGNFNATGGYIAVKQDGELVCYHIYNWNDFQNYLFNNTKIDYPDSSPSRCDFGRVLTANEVSERNGTFIKINFQIRFI